MSSTTQKLFPVVHHLHHCLEKHSCFKIVNSEVVPRPIKPKVDSRVDQKAMTHGAAEDGVTVLRLTNGRPDAWRLDGRRARAMIRDPKLSYKRQNIKDEQSSVVSVTRWNSYLSTGETSGLRSLLIFERVVITLPVGRTAPPPHPRKKSSL